MKSPRKLLALAVALTFGCLSTPGNGGPDEEEKVFGGVDDTTHGAVVLLVRGDRPFCSGTLIGSRHVLTAAHCLTTRLAARGIDVVFGTSLDDPSHVRVAVSNFAVHPGYIHRAGEGPDDVPSCPQLDTSFIPDIALLELAEEVDVEPMPLAANLTEDLVGKDAVLVGFGHNGPDKGGIGQRRMATLQVQAVDPGTIDVDFTESMTFCRGDSGGAVLIEQEGEERLAGVISNIPGGVGVTCGGFGTLRGRAVRTDLHLATIELMRQSIGNSPGGATLVGADAYQMCGDGYPVRTDVYAAPPGTQRITAEVGVLGGSALLFVGEYTEAGFPAREDGVWSTPGILCEREVSGTNNAQCVVELDPVDEHRVFYVQVAASSTVSFSRRVWLD